jgi:hypothetical protein
MEQYLPTDEFTEVEGRAQEFWKDIPDWEGLYQASTHGRIKRLPLELVYSDGQRHYYPEKIYNPPVAGNGYKLVTFRRPGGEQQRFYVHRLVAETFLEKPNGCDTVNHLDANKANNRIDNLEWTTQSGNMSHAIHHYGTLGPIYMRPVVCVETGDEFESCADAARWLAGITSNIKSSSWSIHQVASGNRHTALGYRWKFKEENK